jgi:SAM-dependent methyltransferase
LAEPRKLIAIDNEPQRLEALDEFLEARGATDTVRPYYDVDQADADRLREIISAELDHEPLDLVIDDASHHYDLTRASFEALFPRLRPGGLYIIEDWNADPRFMDAVVKALQEGRSGPPAGPDAGATVTERDPLCRIALELALAAASAHTAVAEVTLDAQVITITRGDAELDDGFTLDDSFRDYFKLLGPRREGS